MVRRRGDGDTGEEKPEGLDKIDRSLLQIDGVQHGSLTLSRLSSLDRSVCVLTRVGEWLAGRVFVAADDRVVVWVTAVEEAEKRKEHEGLMCSEAGSLEHRRTESRCPSWYTR